MPALLQAGKHTHWHRRVNCLDPALPDKLLQQQYVLHRGRHNRNHPAEIGDACDEVSACSVAMRATTNQKPLACHQDCRRQV